MKFVQMQFLYPFIYWSFISIYLSKTDDGPPSLPPFETARALSELFAFQYNQ